MAGVKGRSGGKRQSAGRKTSIVKAARVDFAHEVMPDEEEKQLWRGFLTSPDPKIKFDAARFWTEQKRGKARESVKISGDPENPVVAIVRHIGTDN